MQLTQFTDLGLRILMYLSQDGGNELVTNAEFADKCKAPHNHVIKVVNRLGKLGYVESLRGRHGGSQLSVASSTVRLGVLIKALQGEGELVDCHSQPCILWKRCLLKTALDEALASFFDTLDGYTLADVSGKRTGELLVKLRLAAAH